MFQLRYLLFVTNFVHACFLLKTSAKQEDVVASDVDLCDLPSCSDFSSNSTIEKMCSLSKGMVMRGRCCIKLNNNNMIIGMDLSFCNINSLKKMLYQQAPNLKRLNLTFNPSLSIDEDTFRGLNNLSVLSLPSHLSCPGNWSWFNTSWKAWDMIKHHNLMEVCFNQTNTCSLLSLYNYTCPSHSKCHNDGPALFRCDCSYSWRGYKCLRLPAHFPLLTIGGCTLVATPLLSFALWFSGRRNLR